MEQSPFVSLCQWICRTKNIVVENIVLVGSHKRCAEAENQSENYAFHKK
jgi:hypothetical protein